MSKQELYIEQKAQYFDIWQNKTEWVQEEFSKGILGIDGGGKHRADIMKDEIFRLRKENEEFKATAAELEAANEAFATRQEWWNNKMVELEASLDKLRAEIERMRVDSRSVSEPIAIPVTYSEPVAWYVPWDDDGAPRVSLSLSKPNGHWPNARPLVFGDVTKPVHQTGY